MYLFVFNPIRSYLIFHVLTISTFSRRKKHQELLGQHAEMLMNAAENAFSEMRDVKDVKDRYERLKKQLNNKPPNE
jgi:uncharacterized membrane protein